ncbi:MAG TPA: glycosyltransferase family 61 protein [Mucilaginibacter sp.]|jgi:hypothetical protein|nr:glycosyltransferase family 61 protein [Mucilaginibacter sp.]
MKKTITVPFPLNMSDHETSMYEPYLSYDYKPQKIKYLENIFVTFSGFCLNNRGLIKACHHDYPTQLNDYLNEAAEYYYTATDHPENLLTLDDNNIYLAIHHPWFNYFHWITESIFRLWMVRRNLDKCTLLLPEYFKDADFIMGSLEPFNIKNIYFIPNGKSLMVKNLCLPQIKQVCDSYNRRHLKQVRGFYTNYVQAEKKIAIGMGNKLYVSRRLAKRRKVVNEEEILLVLEKYGFETFHPEKFSFLEQVAIFSRVRYLVGEHGSGLTNLLFVPEGASLLELHKDKTNELDHPSPLFWYMAEGLGIHYYHQLCETYGREDYFDGDYIVDACFLEKNLKLMLSRAY